MELEESSIEFKPVADERPIMPQPPPVNLVAVADMLLHAPAGLEVQLDQFYVGLLKFEREGAAEGKIVYKAENFRICFGIMETPADKPDARPTGINVPSLRALERELVNREIEYQRERGLVVGQSWLLFQDPAGNWVQIGELRAI